MSPWTLTAPNLFDIESINIFLSASCPVHAGGNFLNVRAVIKTDLSYKRTRSRKMSRSWKGTRGMRGPHDVDFVVVNFDATPSWCRMAVAQIWPSTTFDDASNFRQCSDSGMITQATDMAS